MKSTSGLIIAVALALSGCGGNESDALVEQGAAPETAAPTASTEQALSSVIINQGTSSTITVGAAYGSQIAAKITPYPSGSYTYGTYRTGCDTLGTAQNFTTNNSYGYFGVTQACPSGTTAMIRVTVSASAPRAAYVTY